MPPFPQELKNARNLAKQPGPLASAPATADLYPEFKVGSGDPVTMIYQPYLRIPINSDMPHKDAYKMIATRISTAKKADEKQMAARVWAEIIGPMFNYPTHWILNELRGFARESKSFSIVKCKYYMRMKECVQNVSISLTLIFFPCSWSRTNGCYCLWRR